MSPEKYKVAIVVDPSTKDISIGEETKKERPSSSAMSFTGVFAAISYMASAGIYLNLILFFILLVILEIFYFTYLYLLYI